MRRRTLFSLFSGATNQVWFSTMLFLLRVVVGLFVFLFGTFRFAGWTLASEVSKDAWFATWFSETVAGGWFEQVLPWLLIICGVLLMLGAFVRPVSAVLIVMFFFVYAWTFSSDMIISSPLILIVCFGFFMSGGVGHVLGLDFALFHYARKKTWITHALLG